MNVAVEPGDDTSNAAGWVFACDGCGVEEHFEQTRKGQAMAAAILAGWVFTSAIDRTLDLCPRCQQRIRG